MANPTFVKGGTTLTFMPSWVQAPHMQEAARQRALVSSNADVKVLEISTTDDRFVELLISLPREDNGAFEGYDSLRTFIITTVNWRENTFTFTDADGDSFTVRIWDDLNLRETKKDVFEGTLMLREEV